MSNNPHGHLLSRLSPQWSELHSWDIGWTFHNNGVIRALETHDGRLQVLYADTLVTDVPNARAYQANRKIYPESYSDVGTNVHTKQTL